MKRAALMARRGRAWLESVERAWLGWTLPPTRVALAESAWVPDDPSRYCGRCGASVGPGEVMPAGCASCRNAAALADGFVRLGAYSGPLREWVRAIKYRGWAEMADALGRQLGAAVGRRLAHQGELDRGVTVAIPMPMPWQRRLYRGIDHAGVIAAGVAAELDVALMSALVKANGPPQVSLPAGHRARGSGGMRLRQRARRLGLQGAHVILVDDVRTSGASLRAAGRLLRRLGPSRVLAAVLAVTDDRSRRPRREPPAPDAA